ncbi:MAG: hypothetical protein ABR553_06155 [Gammaproteobacteria bacterium]
MPRCRPRWKATASAISCGRACYPTTPSAVATPGCCTRSRSGSRPPARRSRSAAPWWGQDEAGQSIAFRITAIEDGTLKLDANHPLAGETLIFGVEIQAVRMASPAELEQAQGTAISCA